MKNKLQLLMSAVAMVGTLAALPALANQSSAQQDCCTTGASCCAPEAACCAPGVTSQQLSSASLTVNEKTAAADACCPDSACCVVGAACCD